MSDDGFAEELISRDEIAELACLFDAFEFAFDPRSTAAKEAESEFDNKVNQLFINKVAPQYPKLVFAIFYSRIKSHCRIYLRKNQP